MITIVDYGMGNLGSVQNMFNHIGIQSEITNSIAHIEKAEKLLLPGVGAFGAAMSLLKEKNMIDVLNYKVRDKKIPLLGICLGMQLITKSSEEGNVKGLGWVDAETKKFNFRDNSLKIPHMGWNFINIQKSNKLVQNLDNTSKFYFVHSYYVECADPSNVVATTFHGNNFHSIIQNGNIFGAQFHPEKSHKFGMQLLTNFSKI